MLEDYFAEFSALHAQAESVVEELSTLASRREEQSGEACSSRRPSEVSCLHQKLDSLLTKMKRERRSLSFFFLLCLYSGGLLLPQHLASSSLLFFSLASLCACSRNLFFFFFLILPLIVGQIEVPHTALQSCVELPSWAVCTGFLGRDLFLWILARMRGARLGTSLCWGRLFWVVERLCMRRSGLWVGIDFFSVPVEMLMVFCKLFVKLSVEVSKELTRKILP